MATDQSSTLITHIAYDLVEAARHVCLSVDTLRDAVKDGALKARMVGRKYLIRRQDLCEWVDNLPPNEVKA
jgi:excisionase family DNA binding protein